MKLDIRNILKMGHDDLFDHLNTTPEGYTQEQAETLLEETGYNEITKQKKQNPIIGFVNVLINPFNLVLIVVICITFINDILIEKSGDYLTLIILSVVVLASTLASLYKTNAPVPQVKNF